MIKEVKPESEHLFKKIKKGTKILSDLCTHFYYGYQSLIIDYLPEYNLDISSVASPLEDKIEFLENLVNMLCLLSDTYESIHKTYAVNFKLFTDKQVEVLERGFKNLKRLFRLFADEFSGKLDELKEMFNQNVLY